MLIDSTHIFTATTTSNSMNELPSLNYVIPPLRHLHYPAAKDLLKHFTFVKHVPMDISALHHRLGLDAAIPRALEYVEPPTGHSELSILATSLSSPLLLAGIIWLVWRCCCRGQHTSARDPREAARQSRMFLQPPPNRTIATQLSA